MKKYLEIIKPFLDDILIALGASGAVEVLSRIIDPATAKILDGQKATQQVIEAGFESLKTALGSVAEFLSGNPAARDKVGNLDDIAGKEADLSEILQKMQEDKAENAIARAALEKGGDERNEDEAIVRERVNRAIESAIGDIEEDINAVRARRADLLNENPGQASATPLPASPLDPLAPSTAQQGLVDLFDALDARMEELSVAIDGLTNAVSDEPKLKMKDEEGFAPDGSFVRMASLESGPPSVLATTGQAFDELDATLAKVDKSMSKVFENMTLGGGRAANQLSQIFARMDSNILGSLGKLGSFISQIFGGGPASILGSLFGLAGGGTAQPGIPILVGERGPEILIPSGPSRVLNAHNSARAMGGGGMGGAGPRQLVVHQTNSFSTDVKNTVRAEVLNALPLATNLAAQQVADMMRGIRR